MAGFGQSYFLEFSSFKKRCNSRKILAVIGMEITIQGVIIDQANGLKVGIDDG